jgi:4-aminobutyrate aminotransferase-like enzyme
VRAPPGGQPDGGGSVAGDGPRPRTTLNPADTQQSARAALRERAIRVGVGGVLGNAVRIQPPRSITAEGCDRVAAALEAVLPRR